MTPRERQESEWEAVKQEPSAYGYSRSLGETITSAKYEAHDLRLSRQRHAPKSRTFVRVDVKKHPDGGFYQVPRTRRGAKFQRYARPTRDTIAIVTLSPRGCMRTRQLVWLPGNESHDECDDE